jgi:methionyl-tRNA formyltransferase
VRIVFLGTPPFAVPSLEALARAGHEILAVVCQPDRPAGRGRALRQPATKAWARARGLPVLQPEKVRDGGLAEALGPLRPDVLVVAAYGRILGKDLLDLAPEGAVNVHASLLPRYRGAAPIQWAIAEGERETGITLMQMDEGLDTGDILLQRPCAIEPADTGGTLGEKLSALGGSAIAEGLELLAAGRIVPVPQDPEKATLAPAIDKEQGRLDFTLPASRLACRIRAFDPWPGTFTGLRGSALRILGAVPWPAAGLAPGEARAEPEGLLVGCGGGTALLVTDLQLEGKKRLRAAEFLRGNPLAEGTVLGP